MPEALSISATAAVATPSAVRMLSPSSEIGGTVAEFPVNELTIARESVPAFTERLKAKLGKEIYDSWCAGLRLESMNGKNLVFSVPTRFLKNWLQTHYAVKILSCWQEDHPGVSQVEFVIRSPTAKAPVKPPLQIETKRPLPSRLPLERPANPENELVGSPVDPRLTFDNFAVGNSNRLAHTAALLAATGNDAPNPLYLHAGVGLGKSHLLQAIAHSKKSTLYVTAEHFIYSFLASIKSNSPEFKNALRSIDTLLIDDIQFLKNKNTVSDLALVLNSMIDSGRQVVIAGDRQPIHLEDIDDRLKSRLMGGMCVEIAPPDQETRRSILDMRVRFMQGQKPAFGVPGEVLDMIATSLPSTGRDLEGVLNQLMVHSCVDGTPITMEMATTVVQQMLQNQPPRRIRIEDIQKTVARHYNISKDDMISSRRTAAVVRPRQIAIYLAKILTLRSLPEIGRRFGNRDHTTILHAVRKIESLTQTDAAMAKEVEDLKALLAA
jgi:chromosomal replication initiator protein